jgi:hypothetical protein
MLTHENQVLRVAMRIVSLWRERPAAVRDIERQVLAEMDGDAIVDVAAVNGELDRLDAIRDAGPFVAPVDRSLISADVPIARG